MESTNMIILWKDKKTGGVAIYYFKFGPKRKEFQFKWPHVYNTQKHCIVLIAFCKTIVQQSQNRKK